MLIKIKKELSQLTKNIKRDKVLLLIALPTVVYFIVFAYVPMFGAIVAFKDFSYKEGILGSPWAVPLFKQFVTFFDSIYFLRLLRNTLLISLYNILWGFPIPIIFALLLNEIKNVYFKKITQSVSYLPYFISVVVIVGMIHNFLSVGDGLANNIIAALGGDRINFLLEYKYFRTIYIASNIWQNFGFSSIIYIAALSGVNLELYDSAVVDGANKLQQIWYISIPFMLPTIIILLILSLSNIMIVGFEKIILLYNPATYETSDVIMTYVYRKGILDSNFSFGAAVGLFNSVGNLIFLIIFNRISRKTSEVSLW